jgi:ubiquitin-protein ligase
MHSRAYLLIKRDLYLLDNNPVDGIDIEPIVDDNYFDLTLFLRPVKISMWYGCMFRVFCSFYDTFNIQPPILQFDPMHIPYHPNVDPITGRVSLSTSEKWSSRFTLRSLFDELSSIFIIPNQETIINSDAKRMLKYRPNDYQAIIDSAIEKSQHLMELINEEKTNINRTEIILPKRKDGKNKRKIIFKNFIYLFFLGNRARLRTPGMGARRQQQPINSSPNPQISFEEYLNTWRGIATSKANPNEENPLLNELSLQPKLQAQHLALNANELGIIQFKTRNKIYMFLFLARQLDDRALQFERLKYGKLTNDERGRGRKLVEISQMTLSENTQRAPLVITQANSRSEISRMSLSEKSVSENNQQAPLVVTEANSRIDIITNSDDTEQKQEHNYIKNDEVDELIEWTQCLPTTTDETIIEEN